MKNYFKDWTLFEKLILTLGLSVTAIVSFLTHSTVLSLINGICNISNSVLSAKGKISNYYFGIIGNIIYLYISFTTRYYSEVITVLFIVLPISIYGLINWLKGRKNEESDDVNIKSPTTRQLLIPILSQVVMSVPYYLMLKHFNSDLLIVSTFCAHQWHVHNHTGFLFHGQGLYRFQLFLHSQRHNPYDHVGSTNAER